MIRMEEDFISAGTISARRNTWGTYNRTMPSVSCNGSFITYSTSILSVNIGSFEEIVLHILLCFLFMPVWLLRKFFEYQYPMAGVEETVESTLKQWEDLGIVWVEHHVTGDHLRPTYALFQMFGQEPVKYNIIPTAVLTHLVSEQAIMFEVMTGINAINNERVHPRISELGIEGNLSGTNIIAENEFRVPFSQNEYQTILEVERGINDAVKNGTPNLTEELKNFRWFPIVQKVNSTGTLKSDIKFHIPDLIVPVVRDGGKPLSIAVEVELSNKRVVGYEETLSRYKDNNKFAAVYWFCNGQVAGNLQRAYDNIGGTGSCRMELVEFSPPFPYDGRL